MRKKSRTATSNLIATQRREKVIQLRKAGYDYKTICDQVGITKGQVSKILNRALDQYAKDTDEAVLELKQLEDARLDNMQRGVWTKAITGNLTAIDRVLKIMERRAKLHGLDAPQKRELTGKDGAPLGGCGLASLLEQGEDAGS